MLSPALESFRPSLIEALELKEYREPVPLKGPEAAHSVFVLKNPLLGTYLRIGEEERECLAAIDGKTSVEEIILNVYQKRGSFSLRAFYRLLWQLHQGGFLTEPLPVETPSESPSLSRTVKRFTAWEGFWRGGGKITRGVFALGGRFFTYIILASGLIFSLLGLYGYIAFFREPRFTIFLHPERYPQDLAAILISLIVMLSLRRGLQAAALHYYGGEVGPPGVGLRFGLPHLTVGRDDMAFLSARQEAYVAAWGLMTGPILGGAAFLLLKLFALRGIGEGALLTSAIYVLASFCPFYRSDLIHFLERCFYVERLREQTWGYLYRRLLALVVRGDSIFYRETIFISLLIGFLFWIYLAFQLLSLFLQLNAVHILALAFTVNNLLVKIVAYALTFLLLTVSVLFVAAVLGAVLNLLRKWFKNLTAAYHRSEPLVEAFPPDEAMRVLGQVMLFQLLPHEELKKLAEYVELKSYKKGRRIIRQGEAGDAFYAVLQGEVEVLVESVSGWEEPAAELGPGDSFGEIALIEAVPRTANVYAKTDCRLLSIDKAHFDRFIAGSLHVGSRLTQIIRAGKFLRQVPLLKDLASNELMRIAYHMRKEEIPEGKVVIREGDPGDKFYLLESGEVQVVKGSPQAAKELARLKEGDFFGEIALIKNIPRTATVLTLTDAVLFSLDKEHFLGILGANLFTHRIETISGRRLMDLHL